MISDSGLLFWATMYKYVCITNNQPHTKSNANPNTNHTTKQLAMVSIQLKIVMSYTYPQKCIQDNVVAPPLYISLVTFVSNSGTAEDRQTKGVKKKESELSIAGPASAVLQY